MSNIFVNVPNPKCLFLLMVLLLVSKHDIDHWNLLFRISGAFKNGLKRKNPYYLRSKNHFSYSRTQRPEPIRTILWLLILTHKH